MRNRLGKKIVSATQVELIKANQERLAIYDQNYGDGQSPISNRLKKRAC